MSKFDRFLDKKETKITKNKLKSKVFERNSFLNTKGLSKIKVGFIFGNIDKNKVIKLENKVEKEVNEIINEQNENQNKDICLEKGFYHPYKGISKDKLILKHKPIVKDKPQSRRLELKHNCMKNEAFDLIKKVKRLENKRNKIIKTKYKQGIIGFDSPEIGSSKYYKVEAIKHKQLLLKNEIFDKKRRKYLQKFTNSSHLFNLNTKEVEHKYQKHMPKKKRCLPDTVEYKTSSFKKLFGDKEVCQVRRKYLGQLSKVDIISNTIQLRK